MALNVALRDGGKTNEEGFSRLLNKLAGTLNEGAVQSTDFAVTEKGTPNMSVDVAVGDIVIPYQTYLFHGWNTAVVNVVIAASDVSNGRLSRIVAYVDLSVVSSASANNPGALKVKEVAGTASGSPVQPNDAAVQSSVGSGNPWTELALVTVDAGATTIVNAKIANRRARFLLGGAGAMPPFCVNGTLVVQNGGFMPNWIVPPGVAVINRLDSVMLTGPTGSAATFRLYNVTQAHAIGSISISAGQRIGSTTIMDFPEVANGDEIRFDCTAIGSTIAGADVTVQPSA